MLVKSCVERIVLEGYGFDECNSVAKPILDEGFMNTSISKSSWNMFRFACEKMKREKFFLAIISNLQQREDILGMRDMLK